MESKALSEKISRKTANIGIVGIGYVGSALAHACILAGFQVLGFTRDADKARRINNPKKRRFTATTNLSRLRTCDIICICVPTPIYEDKTPDLRPLEESLTNVSAYLRAGQLIIIESSVGVGMTRSIAVPLLERTKLVCGKDFFLAYSPERVDPGNRSFSFRDIPKVVAGFDDMSKELAVTFYQKIIALAVPVSSLETAEMTKLLENTFRLVNISLINELTEYTKARGIDIWEVIAAAKTKPFGFLAHYPGPGVGGHCIPVDPHYLLSDARARNIPLTLVEDAGKINDRQVEKVIARALEILKERNGQKDAYEVLLIGVAYKRDVPDMRESPALRILESFHKQGFTVSYHDPHIPSVNGFASQALSSEVMQRQDLLVITTDHSAIDYSQLLAFDRPILDTRNALRGFTNPNIYRIFL